MSSAGVLRIFYFFNEKSFTFNIHYLRTTYLMYSSSVEKIGIHNRYKIVKFINTWLHFIYLEVKFNIYSKRTVKKAEEKVVY